VRESSPSFFAAISAGRDAGSRWQSPARSSELFAQGGDGAACHRREGAEPQDGGAEPRGQMTIGAGRSSSAPSALKLRHFPLFA
jgi:hypothetical protein